MRKFLYFLCADVEQMRTRLARLQEKGLELVSVEGFFSGEFAETKRQDLKYLVLPFGNRRNFPRDPEVYERFGWELLGGFNGMAIFKSLPCAEPDAEKAEAKMRLDGCYHEDRHTIPLLTALLLFGAILLLWLLVRRGFGVVNLWSYTGLCGYILPVMIGLFALANLVTLKSYAGAWVRSIGIFSLCAAALLGLLAVLLDWTQTPIYFAGITLCVAGACFACFWPRNRAVAAGIAAACLVMLCLGLAFPNQSITDAGTKALRYSVADRPVVTLEDLWETDEKIEYSGYTLEGTFLIRRTMYWEQGENHSVSGEIYRCLTSGLADQMERYLADHSPAGRDECVALVREGNTVALVVSEKPITEEQLGAISKCIK